MYKRRKDNDKENEFASSSPTTTPKKAKNADKNKQVLSENLVFSKKIIDKEEDLKKENIYLK